MTSQRDQARAKANRVRVARGKLHHEIRVLPFDEGRALLADVLRDPPDFLLTAPVLTVLDWPHQMGSTRAERMMRSACVGPLKTVGDVTDRQRRDLARCLLGLGTLVEAEEHDRIEQAREAA